MASTLTTFADLLKERYADANMVEQLSMADEPLYSMLEKAGDANIAGSEFVVPIIYSNPQGVAGNYTDALANTSNIAAAAWHIVPGNHVGTVEIGDKVLKASRGNNGAILDNKRVEIDGLYTTMGESQAAHIWGNGGQSIGQIGTIVSTNVWELADKAQICNFEYGMEIVLSTGDGSSTSDSEVDSGNSTTVAAVDRNLGRITVTGSDISGEAVGDYIFREGEFYGDQYASNAIMTGVQAFVDNQTTLPTLWGVSNTVRAYDRERFGGCSVPDADVNGMALSARIKTLLAWMAGRYKSKVPTHGFLHPEDFQLLETELEARRISGGRQGYAVRLHEADCRYRSRSDPDLFRPPRPEGELLRSPSRGLEAPLAGTSTAPRDGRRRSR